MERTDLIEVFDKFASQKVRRILGLFVEDGDGFSHSDAAIERAIRGKCCMKIDSDSHRNSALEIEYWDWKKPDLSLDTIAFAAPNVKSVNLYWSGNWTVLRGWCCPSKFIPELDQESKPDPRFDPVFIPAPMLETIHLHAFTGSEGPKRVEIMIGNFKQMINGWSSKTLAVEEKMYPSTINFGILPDEGQDLSVEAETAKDPDQEWLKAMDNLRTALMGIVKFLAQKNKPPEPIKVAVIDDGVDLDKIEFPADILQITGMSFCSPIGKRERPWHQSDNGHGTTMVNMGLRFFPWIKLEVMKIEQGRSYSSQGATRTIYPDSAAKAIEAAIIRDADIISMSWTIKRPTKELTSNIPDSKERSQSISQMGIQALCNALKDAAEDNILMFCSAADNVNLEGRDTLPFSAAPDAIFRIGAATEYGQRDPASEDPQNISYYFPGNHVAELRNPRSTKPVVYHDGSSISTALAASFTATLLSMVNMLVAYYEASDDEDHSNYRTYMPIMRRSYGTMRIFG
ncbi:peptidase S8/S53 domain-containing protein [Trichoderma austrokoningii]